MPLTIPTTLMVNDLRAADRLMRRWYVLPVRFLQDIHGYLYLYVGVVGLAGSLLFTRYRRDPDLLIGTLVAVLLSSACFAFIRFARLRNGKRKLLNLNGKMVRATFTDASIELYTISGKQIHVPWDAYRSAILDESILVLRRNLKKRTFNIYPLTTLTRGQRGELLDLLRDKLGPGNVKLAGPRVLTVRPGITHVR